LIQVSLTRRPGERISLHTTDHSTELAFSSATSWKGAIEPVATVKG